MASKTSAGPRERLLSAANKLFYEEGIHTVGIDRVIAKAGVAKASLYSAFGSKDELVRAYVELRHEQRKERIEEAMAKHRTPRARLIAVFDVLAERMKRPDFRGCAFVRASAEGPADGAARSQCAVSRAWLRNLFTDLATEGGAAHPSLLARQMVLLYDGASISAQMDGESSSAELARDVAVSLFDAATRRPPSR